MKKTVLIFIGIFFLGLLFFFYPSHQEHKIHLTGTTMGTIYNLKMVLPDQISKNLIHHEVSTFLKNINQIFSIFIKDSEISKFNQKLDTEWHKISDSLIKVLSQAQIICQKTSGAFDITIQPLMQLWKFSTPQKLDQIPSSQELHQAMKQIGCQKIEIDLNRQQIRKTQPKITLDLSSIAKGYAVDAVADFIEAKKIHNYLIEIGGEIRTKGLKNNQSLRKIGIEFPHLSQRKVFTVIKVKDIGIATSGDYRNFQEINGQKYTHIMDPRKGSPVKHRLASVTVLDHQCMVADAWATALMVMGPESGYIKAEQAKIPAFFIIYADGHQLVTKATSQFKLITH